MSQLGKEALMNSMGSILVNDVIDIASDLPVPEASWDLYDMIQAFLQAPFYHIVFEILLILWIVYLLFFTKSYKPPHRSQLSEQEIEELVEEWQPEPLVPDVDQSQAELQNFNNRIVDSKLGKYVSICGKKCLNVATMNFLGMVGRPELEEDAIKSLRKYGVGACGPRGFYGTVDVHLELEEKIQNFLNIEEAIVYSFGFATIASAIPAYSKRGDIIFCDEGVHFAIQKGLTASRSKVVFFKHNDMEDLERVLQLQEQEDKKNIKKAKATRRFLVVEGLYMNYGDICPLPKLVELKWKYKVRLFVDESVSFGALGATGKGVSEHFGVSIDEIDLVSGSLENAIGTIGGFCGGKAYVIDHQRLSGLGYCFSASAPPMLSKAATTAINIIEQSPEMLSTLHSNCDYMHEQLTKFCPKLTHVGESISPVKHLQVHHWPNGEKMNRAEQKRALQAMVELAEESGVALTLAAYLDSEEKFLPPPSIKLCVSCELSTEEMDQAVRVIKDVSSSVLQTTSL